MSDDARWGDPDFLPLSNGPIRVVTAPIVPRSMIDQDGRVIEYLLSWPMHIIDNSIWKRIEFIVNGIPISIQRPIPATAQYEPEGRLGNESPEAFCTIIRVRTPLGAELSTDDGWRVVESLLLWIRVKCRHYWLLHGMTGFGAVYRCSILTRNGKRLFQKNVSTYGPNVIVRPLTEALWLSIQDELEADTEIPLADSIYCDALLSIVAGDQMKALLEAGVAAEVAITQLLLEVSDCPPDSPAKKNFRKTGDFDRFKKKLTEWPQLLGLEAADSFKFQGMPADWVTTVQNLYKLRNGVAHGGKIKTAAPANTLTAAIFAVSTLLQYCREQRSRVGLPSYSMPSGSSIYEQIVMYHDGFVSTNSGLWEGLLS